MRGDIRRVLGAEIFEKIEKFQTPPLVEHVFEEI